MVDSKTLKISIGAIIKDPEMLEIIPGHLSTKKMCKNAVKKSLFILGISEMLMFIPDCYKDQNMCNIYS